MGKNNFWNFVNSRGKMLRPFEVLLHAPAIASVVAELGANLRFDSSLSDHDRELAILATAKMHGCAFEWDSHLPLAVEAGVRPEVIDHLEGGDANLTPWENTLVQATQELCATSTLSDEQFAAIATVHDDRWVVELLSLIGYYTLLSFVMGAADAC